MNQLKVFLNAILILFLGFSKPVFARPTTALTALPKETTKVENTSDSTVGGRVIQEAIQIINANIKQNKNLKKDNIQIVAIELKQVNTQTHTDYDFELGPSEIKVKFYFDRTSSNNPSLLFKDLGMVQFLASQWVYDQRMPFVISKKQLFRDRISVAHYVELKINSDQGSFLAKKALLQYEIEVLQSMVINPAYDQRYNVSQENQNLLELKQRELSDLQKQIDDPRLSNQKSQIFKRQQDQFNSLESQSKLLNNLILSNDRKGVVSLLRVYLPWAYMEPVERKTWEGWLEAIEHPNWQNTKIVLRGIRNENFNMITKNDKSSYAYALVSNIIKLAEGNSTEKLRALSKNRVNYPFAQKAAYVPQAEIDVGSINNQMYVHSVKPTESNFISTTYDLKTAIGFSGQDPFSGRDPSDYSAVLALQIDSRRALTNLNASADEMEVLVPLIIFPDEILAIKKGRFESDKEQIDFINHLQQKTGKDLSYMYRKSEQNFTKKQNDFFNQESFSFLTDLVQRTSLVNWCRGLF